MKYEIDENGCWIWKGYVAKHGYGYQGRVPAHRAVYIEHRGVIPPGLDLDHLCRVRACVNPDHLEPVTRAENLRRGKNVRFTKADIRDIRTRVASGEMQKTLAEAYSVAPAYISLIVNHYKWAGV